MARATDISAGITTGMAAGIATGMVQTMVLENLVLMPIDGITILCRVRHRRNVEIHGERNATHMANANGFI